MMPVLLMIVVAASAYSGFLTMWTLHNKAKLKTFIRHLLAQVNNIPLSPDRHSLVERYTIKVLEEFESNPRNAALLVRDGLREV